MQLRSKTASPWDDLPGLPRCPAASRLLGCSAPAGVSSGLRTDNPATKQRFVSRVKVPAFVLRGGGNVHCAHLNARGKYDSCLIHLGSRYTSRLSQTWFDSQRNLSEHACVCLCSRPFICVFVRVYLGRARSLR